MKINRNEFERIYNPKLNKSNSTDTKKAVTTTESGDKIELSNSAKEYSVIKGFVIAAAKDASMATQTEKLMQLKNSIKNNSYEVLPDAVVDAIMK